ncbi:MAG: YciI family protein [Pseudomonadota bacterium]
MSHFLITCFDKPNSLELRMATRPAHLEYVDTFSDARKIAGPMLDSEGKPKGSAFIMDLANIDAAEDFVKNDPYEMAGLFAHHSIELFSPLMGQWVGG